MSKITTNLKLMLLNAENLFLLSDHKLTKEHLNFSEQDWKRLSTSVYENKSLLKTKTLAAIVKNQAPDIIMLCEVGGLESLKNFSSLFLDDEYSPVLTEGNSVRHIDVGFLIKKDLGFYFDLVSNKNRSLNFLYPHEQQSLDAGVTTLGGKSIQSHKFSRDAAELHFFLRNKEQPFLILVLSHLKSRLDPDGIDPNGYERRMAELKTLVDVYLELESRFSGAVPIAVCGDFNGNASHSQTDPEFADLYDRTKLRDVCEIAQLPSDERSTYYQVGRSKTEGRQIDFCFLSPKLTDLLDKNTVKVYRYLDANGLPADPPTTLDAKSLLPSDHYPIFFEIRNISVR